MSTDEKIVPFGVIGQRHLVHDAWRRPIHDLRISVMDRCNFRCPYCMPRETFHESYRFLKSSERLDFSELLQLARVFVRAGVRKIRITGGEPLLRPSLADFIGDLTSIPGLEDIALTTNGILLAKYASELKAAGLDRITVSLDTLDPDIFARMSGGFGGVAEVLDGIEHARRAGLAPIKINTVVQRGVNDHTLLDLLAHFRGTGVIVRFIEYMDVGTRNRWQPELVVPSAELAARIHARWPISPRDRRYQGEVAERYVYDDGAGEVGFISSVSQPFCGDCSRARLSSDGSFYTCLFATQGTDLRQPIRAGASDDELFELIRAVWSARRDRYSEQRASLRNSSPDLHKVEMNHIGG
jgi:GTP 3',8-cyclase